MPLSAIIIGFEITLQLLHTAETFQIFPSASNIALDLRFNSDMEVMLSIHDKYLQIWQVHSGECFRVLRRNNGQPWHEKQLAVFSDCKFIAANYPLEGRGVVRIWTMDTTRRQHILEASSQIGEEHSVQISPGLQ